MTERRRRKVVRGEIEVQKTGEGADGATPASPDGAAAPASSTEAAAPPSPDGAAASGSGEGAGEAPSTMSASAGEAPSGSASATAAEASSESSAAGAGSRRRRGTRGGAGRHRSKGAATGDAAEPAGAPEAPAAGGSAPAAESAPGAGTPAEEQASAVTAPAGEQTPAAGGAAGEQTPRVAAEAAPRPRAKRGASGRRRVEPAAGQVEGAPEGDAAEGTPEGDEAAPKRRRRGSRGGRRVRAREARRAAAQGAGGSGSEPSVKTGAPEGPAAPGEPGHAEGSAAAGEPAGDERPTLAAQPTSLKGPTAAEMVIASTESEEPRSAEGRAAEGQVAEGAEAAPAVREDERKRRGRRGGRRTKRAEAVAAPVAAEPTLLAATAPAAPTAAVSAAESGAVSETERGAGAEAEPGTGAAAMPGAGPERAPAGEERTATKSRRRDRRRPKAIAGSEGLTGADASAIEGPALTTGRRPEVSVELPKRKLILVTEDPHELRVALVEDGRLAEIYFERPERRSYLGDIYRGKVESVLPGIDAAFVDFGIDKNGFLYVDEVRTGEGDRRGRRITDVLKPGQDVVVQVMKDPMGSKGARLTMHFSLPGRYVVYVPGGSGVGVSRRLGQGERERLRELCKQLRVKNAGLIVRTAAEGKGLDEIRRDVRYLSRLWSRLKKKAETAPIPGLIHQEVDIALEVARDLFNESVESLIVDDEKRLKTITAYLEKVAPELVPKVRLHTGAEPLFDAYGIEEQISRALERRVPLPSGGNIVIDHAEALTVIDVNSGRFTRGRGLEDTILRTNLEAAREVVRQLRLRDIGGIIIIDFIDMARIKNRETVLATLEAELDTDRTKTYVVELSPLGLVEMTRQNTTDGARGILTRTCQTCQGKARTLSEETVALSVERRLRAQSKRSGAKACLVEVNTGVAERLTAGGRLRALEKETGRRIFVEGSSTVPVDAFRMLAEGPVAQVEAQLVPVREGQEVEIELEYSLTYSPRDAVGYVDGYMVIVEGGRGFVGQRRKVRITTASRTGGTAVLTGGRSGGGRS